ncbi:MAG: hypothetical protein JO050_10580 [Acidimicrobiia bacterium]|nr:hypothetical protein [Acidimicrobiia bacterium]
MQRLVGTFVLGQPSCPAGHPAGSWFIVSFGSKVQQNSASPCAGGAATLLNPGTVGLPTGRFLPDARPTFDGQGDSLSAGVIQPTLFGSQKLGMATSPDDVQDAPDGPAAFSAPEALTQDGNLVVDLRALDVTYRGQPDSTCASDAGNGCWQEGSEQAAGSYDPATGAFSLEWFSSQGFTGASAGVTFHLAGTFVGRAGVAPPGTNLSGTPRFAVTDSAASTTSSPASASAQAPATPKEPDTTVPAPPATSLAATADSVGTAGASPAATVLRAAAAALVVIIGAAALVTGHP